MKHINLLLLLGIPALLFTGCKNTGSEPVNDDRITVKVTRPAIAAQGSESSYVGVIEESLSVPLSFLIPGTVEKVLVNEGDQVKKGQLLASLNNISYQSAYQAALAREKQAQDAYDRLLTVYKNGSLPEVKMIEMETGLEQARSALQIARKNMGDCNLYAPVTGIAGRRFIEPGMNVIPGNAAVTLVKINPVHIKIGVPENEISKVNPGQEAVITVPALNNETYTGKVFQKGVMANPLSHTYEVKITLENHLDRLRPGMIANVRVSTGAPAKIITIPQQAVQVDQDGRKFVFIADTTSSTALRRYIETGTPGRNSDITVEKGLEAGDLVITGGYQKVNHNMPVKILY